MTINLKEDEKQQRVAKLDMMRIVQICDAIQRDKEFFGFEEIVQKKKWHPSRMGVQLHTSSSRTTLR